MQEYGVRDVEKLLGVPRSTIRALIAAGFVAPARGARNAWRFSFQDLIVLRTAQALANAKVPHRRILKSLKEMRRHLPEEMPMSGLRIGAVADRVVVREGDTRWQAESGQYLLAFEGDPVSGSLTVIDRSQPTPSEEADWYARAVELERDDSNAAMRAYENALAADPAHLDASINLGRLLHESGRFVAAEKVYRDAIAAGSEDAVLLFNLAVLLEDLKRPAEAAAAYETALRADASLADGHYNLSLLYQQLGKDREAIRHMAHYRRLVGNA